MCESDAETWINVNTLMLLSAKMGYIVKKKAHREAEYYIQYVQGCKLFF